MIYNYRKNKRRFRNFLNHEKNDKNLFGIDEVLLRTLLTIQSPSREEDVMIEFIKNWIAENILGATVTEDRHGNLYITKSTNNLDYFPCIVAHTDEVCADSDDREVVKVGNILMGINPMDGEWAGIGGDDKCGIYIALEMLRLLPDVKCFFPVSEEIGGIGSESANLSFFDNCGFLIQPDRFGNSSIITRTNGLDICTDEFLDELTSLMFDYDYKEDCTGSFTDIGVLAERGLDLCSINVSCGYYDQHDYEEKVCVPDVENAMNLIYKICSKLMGKRFINYTLEEQLFRTQVSYYNYGWDGYEIDTYSDTSKKNTNKTLAPDDDYLDQDDEFYYQLDLENVE